MVRHARSRHKGTSLSRESSAAIAARTRISGCRGLRYAPRTLYAAAFAFLASDAFAADLSVTWPVKAQSSALGYDWNGFYAGGHIGLAAGHPNWILTPLDGGLPVGGSFGLYRSPNAFTEGGSWLEGVQAGYNWMLPNRLVLGIEADGSFPVFPDPAGLTIGGVKG